METPGGYILAKKNDVVIINYKILFLFNHGYGLIYTEISF